MDETAIRDQAKSSETLGMLEASPGSHSTSKQEKGILNDALLTYKERLLTNEH